MIDENTPRPKPPISPPVAPTSMPILPPTSSPRSAWSALIVAAEIAWVAFAVFVYLMGLNEDSQYEQIVQRLWSNNIIQVLGRSRIPYECCNRWLTFDFAFFVLFPALVIAGVLLLLRWLDENSGLLLLERLRKLFLK